MSHLDPEQLALIALGEPVASPAEREHLASCPVCAAEVAEMTHAAVVARSTMDEPRLEVPPARVWDAIAGELALSDEVADPFAAEARTEGTDAAPAPGAFATSPDAAPTGPAPTGLTSADPAPTGTPETDAQAGETASVDSAPGSPRRRWSQRAWWVLAASFALVLVVGGGVWVAVRGSLAPTSIASASLEAFPDHAQAVGTAEVDEARDGARTLTVTLEGDAASDDYREVWLIRNDGEALISLGVLEGESGSFAIPAGVDLAQYDLVDISFEPIDGDPAHSGDSIVRGRLTFV
ncbi:anti-sigma factor [Microbacterium sp. NPDC019599]|uniref:anti-sigma factor n=1 Tax=Microbacterium sp. NPDC019599 TaxID=3154690 RepID=UPI0033D8B318